jgi:hypothetical protein
MFPPENNLFTGGIIDHSRRMARDYFQAQKNPRLLGHGWFCILRRLFESFADGINKHLGMVCPRFARDLSLCRFSAIIEHAEVVFDF